MLSKKVLKAWDFAKEKHGNQQYGKHSYMYHLDRVLGIVIEMGLDEDYQIVAVLHDTMEDTNTKFEEIEENFGYDVAESVQAITKQEYEEYEEYLQRCCHDELGKQVKICDILSNLYESTKTNKHQLVKKYQKALFQICMNY